jgi:hypothetical protein
MPSKDVVRAPLAELRVSHLNLGNPAARAEIIGNRSDERGMDVIEKAIESGAAPSHVDRRVRVQCRQQPTESADRDRLKMSALDERHQILRTLRGRGKIYLAPPFPTPECANDPADALVVHGANGDDPRLRASYLGLTCASTAGLPALWTHERAIGETRRHEPALPR